MNLNLNFFACNEFEFKNFFLDEFEFVKNFAMNLNLSIKFQKLMNLSNPIEQTNELRCYRRHAG